MPSFFFLCLRHTNTHKHSTEPSVSHSITQKEMCPIRPLLHHSAFCILTSLIDPLSNKDSEEQFKTYLYYSKRTTFINPGHYTFAQKISLIPSDPGIHRKCLAVKWRTAERKAEAERADRSTVCDKLQSFITDRSASPALKNADPLLPHTCLYS